MANEKISGTFRVGTQFFVIALGPRKTNIKGARVRIVCMQLPPWIQEYYENHVTWMQKNKEVNVCRMW